MKLKNFSIKLRLTLKKFIIESRKTHLKDLRNSFLTALKKLPDIVHLKNLVFFGSLLSLITLAFFVQRFSSLKSYYQIEKPDYGGSYSQGVVGSIDKINPLFIQNDAEKAASLLVFSGLTRITDGTKVQPDLAKSWTISKNGLVYSFKLKNNINWHDGGKFTADDVIYTIGLIQNDDTKSSLESVWKGVKVEKINDYEVEFTLPNPYPNFLTVASQVILPQHALSTVSDVKNIKIAEFFNAPIGTGPYKFVRFDQVGSQSEAIFKRNDNFALGKPYIQQIKIVTYENEKSLFEGLSRKQVEGVLNVSPEMYKNISKISISDSIYKKLLPQYQVIFFNLKNNILSDKNVRTALSAAVNRQALIDKVLSGYGDEQSTPLLSGQLGYSSKEKGIEYSPAKANSSLESLGWKKAANGIREKDGKKLSFRLITVDSFESKEDAKLLKSEFREIGVNLDIVSVGSEQIANNYVNPRNFDLLLISQNIGFAQDWYSLWHSSQVTSPGMNLSGYSDKKLDRFLEQVRKSNDPVYITERIRQIEEIIVEQAPVIYLYRPVHIFAITDQVKGSEQSRISEPIDIINNIYKWYINTKV